jgi:hypothetical protein
VSGVLVVAALRLLHRSACSLLLLHPPSCAAHVHCCHCVYVPCNASYRCWGCEQITARLAIAGPSASAPLVRTPPNYVTVAIVPAGGSTSSLSSFAVKFGHVRAPRCCEGSERSCG